MCRWPLAALFALGGCALVSSASPDSTKQQDLGSSPSTPVDMTEAIIANLDMARLPPPPLRDDAGHVVAIVDMAKVVPPGSDMATVPCPAAQHLIINEVEINGPAGTSDEFVEIFNPCTSGDQPIGNFKLLHRSTSGTTDQPTLSIPAGAMVHDYYLIAGPSYSGAKAYDIKYTSAMLSSAGGGLALKDASGKTVDSMGWGAGATNAYVVGSPATSPPDGKSLARIPNGSTAKMDDAQDFQTATPSPGVAN